MKNANENKKVSYEEYYSFIYDNTSMNAEDCEIFTTICRGKGYTKEEALRIALKL